MPDRYRTVTQVIGPVNANVSRIANIGIVTDNINVVKIKVVPSILGGTAIYQIYDRDTFLAANLVYGTHAIAGVYDDPITIDDNGNAVASESARMLLIPFYDRDETNELHFRITNQDAQVKNFELTLVFEVPVLTLN